MAGDECERHDLAEAFFHEVYGNKMIRPTHKLQQASDGSTTTVVMAVDNHLTSMEELPMDKRITKNAETREHTRWIQEEMVQLLNATAKNIE